MELKVAIEDLRKRKLFVATPMYGGQCAGMYTRSIADLTALCVKYGIEFKSYFLFNESLITRARNYCADEFLRSGYTHLMFIDSDIGFDANDVIALLAMCSEESPYDVIGAPYPKKCISWEKIRAAVNKGVADEDPNRLDEFVGDYVFNPVVEPGAPRTIQISEPAEVLEIGTGFMMVKRTTFEEYERHYPEQLYRPDHVRTEAFDGSRQIMAYFDCIIEPKSRRYLSEDYMFCQNVRKMKARNKVWLAPWMKLQHVGSYIFGGSLAALASIGASATADPGVLKRPQQVRAVVPQVTMKEVKDEDKSGNGGSTQELQLDPAVGADTPGADAGHDDAEQDHSGVGPDLGGVPGEGGDSGAGEVPGGAESL